jgi:hypothetical protein
MSRRRVLLGGVVLLALGVAVVTLPRLTRKINPPAVSHERYGRIKEAMTVEEVEAVLGVPPGDYQTRRHRLIANTLAGGDYVWRGDEGAIVVYFDGSGRVESHLFIDISGDIVDEGPSFVERLKGWLGL